MTTMHTPGGATSATRGAGATATSAAGWAAGAATPGSHGTLPPEEFTGELICTAITPVTHDVVDLAFRASSGAPLPFSPGQYYTFTFPQVGEDRCYSVSSVPQRGGAEEFTITVKRVPGGPVSTYLHTEFRVGDVVQADGPYGTFGSDVRPGAGALYLSAGSGVTPFLSMMRARHQHVQSGDRSLPLWSSVVHVHSAHTPADLVHRHEIMSLDGQDDTTLIPVCSEDSAAEAWAGVRGRLTTERLRVLVPDLVEREIFVCGPTHYMHAALDMLVELGVPPERIHTESYVFGEPVRVPDGEGAAPVALADPQVRPAGGEGGANGGGASATEVFNVEFRGAGCMVQCPVGMTILEAAREAGMPLPSSCSEGVCGTCKSTMLSGDVDMDHAGGIRPREIREGKILPCCSVPLTDVVME